MSNDTNEEVLGDTAPVLEPAQVSQSHTYAPMDPFGGGSVVLTTSNPVDLGQLRQEISEAVSAPESDIKVSYSCSNADAPISASNEAHVFIAITGHKVAEKALAKVLAAHSPAVAPGDDVAPAQPPPVVPVLDGENAALVDRLREGDTLTTKELSSVLGAWIG